MDPKTTPDKAIEAATILVTPQAPDVGALWREGLVSQSSSTEVPATSTATGPTALVRQGDVASHAVTVTPDVAAVQQTILADSPRPAATKDVPSHDLSGYTFAVITAKESVEAKVREWQLAPTVATSFANRISRIVENGHMSEEQVTKALQLSNDVKHAIRIIALAAENNVDVALQAQLLDLAKDFQSPAAILTKQFKEFYASSVEPLAQGEDKRDIHRELSAEEISNHAGIVDRKIEEFDDLRGVMKGYSESVSFGQTRPLSFSLLMDVYYRLGSVDDVHTFVRALVEQNQTPHSPVAKRLISHIQETGSAPDDIESFVEDFSNYFAQFAVR